MLRKRGSGRLAALGFRAHSGWAAMVTVTAAASGISVVQRRRLELIDGGMDGAAQPYHAAEPMALREAEMFLARCAKSTNALAGKAVRETLAELAQMGFAVVGACILMGSGRPAGSLAATLASHPMIHTAEGEFFREALKKGCEASGITVTGLKEKELMGQAAGILRTSEEELSRRVTELGRSVGPPWTQDQKLCAAAGWLVLERAIR
jgi:hypothetical protein